MPLVPQQALLLHFNVKSQFYAAHGGPAELGKGKGNDPESESHTLASSQQEFQLTKAAPLLERNGTFARSVELTRSGVTSWPHTGCLSHTPNSLAV